MKFEHLERDLDKELDEATINKVVNSMRQIEAHLKQMRNGHKMTITKEKGEYKIALDVGE